MDELKNKKVKDISWQEDKITFFISDNTTITYAAWGDCCSSSYINDLDNPEIFKNATILDVKHEYGEQERSDYQVTKWSFYKFKTDKGMCTLSFRNESNGYYDGYLMLA